jgi:sorting nexin-1/2
MSGASSAFHKMQEVDEWFDVKKAYLDQLESQLKLLAKAIDNLVRHRDGKPLSTLYRLLEYHYKSLIAEVAETTEDFGEAVFALASAEINKSAEKHLNAFGDVQRQIRQVHQQQARSDVFYLANTIDEYIRLIGSIRVRTCSCVCVCFVIS